MTKKQNDTQPKTQPTKPSAGALRAAEKIILGHIVFTHYAAEIIDHETGVAELLVLAKEYKEHGGSPPWESKPFDHDDWLYRLEQAIAKCESGTGSE